MHRLENKIQHLHGILWKPFLGKISQLKCPSLYLHFIGLLNKQRFFSAVLTEAGLFSPSSGMIEKFHRIDFSGQIHMTEDSPKPGLVLLLSWFFFLLPPETIHFPHHFIPCFLSFQSDFICGLSQEVPVGHRHLC